MRTDIHAAVYRAPPPDPRVAAHDDASVMQDAKPGAENVQRDRKPEPGALAGKPPPQEQPDGKRQT